MPGAGFVQQVATELGGSGVDLGALGLGWARAAPVVAIVPAFGLRALPGPARALMALALAACVAPAMRPDTDPGVSTWTVALLASCARGLPVAVAAAVPLWAATMAGGLIDAVRGSNETVAVPVVEGRPSAFGVLLALLASATFLGLGGPARVAAALALPDAAAPLSALRVALELLAGIEIAFAIAAPVLAASVVIEVAAALVARAAAPAPLAQMLAPLRSLAVVAVVALALERMSRLLALLVANRP
jgi:type III secretory pathway component EscT